MGEGEREGEAKKPGRKRRSIARRELERPRAMFCIHHRVLLRAVVYLIVGIAMAQCQATAAGSPPLPSPSLRLSLSRSRDTRGVSSLEHESVYKFMIMTTLLHTSMTFRTLFPLSPPPTPGSGLCARCRRVHRFMLSAFSLSPHCVRRYDDPILHLYSTVRDSSRGAAKRVRESERTRALACHARFCRTREKRDATRRYSETRKRSRTGERGASIFCLTRVSAGCAA